MFKYILSRPIILCDYAGSLKNLQTLTALEKLVRTPIAALLRKNLRIRSDPTFRQVPFGPCSEFVFDFELAKFELETKQKFQKDFFPKIFDAEGKIWKNWLTFSAMITQENMLIFGLQEVFKGKVILKISELI